MKYKELTHKIIGCAMKVHSTLGNGFQEVIYQRTLAIEMENQGLKFQRELGMPIYYEGNSIGTRRVDFFVEGAVMVELKALTALEEVHLVTPGDSFGNAITKQVVLYNPDMEWIGFPIKIYCQKKLLEVV
jgi:GxxExxY protein